MLELLLVVVGVFSPLRFNGLWLYPLNSLNPETSGLWVRNVSQAVQAYRTVRWTWLEVSTYFTYQYHFFGFPVLLNVA